MRYRRAEEHPGTLHRNWLNALKEYAPEVQVETVTENSAVMHSFLSRADFGEVHVIRNAYGLPFIPRNIPFRWRVRTHYILSRLTLAAVVRRLKPDLVHAHGTEGAYALTALDTGLPHVISIQGIMRELASAQPHDGNFRIRVGMEKKAVKRGRNFIAKSSFAEIFIRELNPEACIARISNPVHPAFTKVNACPGGHRAFLFVGRMVRAKGVDILLQSLQDVQPCRLIMAGDCDMPEAKSLRACYNNGLNIEWRGHLRSEEIADCMTNVDALVLPSLMDTSPNSIIEAHCAGLPVIGTRVGGIPDMVRAGETGWLIPASSREALTLAMRDCMENVVLTRKMGEQARREGLERYAPQNSVRKLMALYQQVLSGREFVG